MGLHNYQMGMLASRNRWVQCGAALALPALVVALYALTSQPPEQSQLVLLAGALVLSAFFGGLSSGLCATAVAVPLAVIFLHADLATALTLVAFGALSSALLEAARRQRTLQPPESTPVETPADERRVGDDRFSVVFHAAPVAIMIVRLSDGRFVDVNSAFTDVSGYTRAQAIGRTSTELRLWVEPRQLIDTLRKNRHSDVQSLQILHANGEIRDVLASVTLTYFDDEAHLLITAADVTERKRARQMEHIAHHDTLTNLPNRLLLQRRLEEALERARAGGRLSAVLFIDLDRFKQVNDRFGHRAGDELLRLAAARLQSRLRATDTLARVGGDEFVVLLEDIATREEAEAIAAGLVQQMASPFALSSGREAHIGASIGLSYFSGETTDAEALVQQADAALYAAKNAGRSTVRVYRPSRPGANAGAA